LNDGKAVGSGLQHHKQTSVAGQATLLLHRVSSYNVPVLHKESKEEDKKDRTEEQVWKSSSPQSN
jgi:hypothetical protein